MTSSTRCYFIKILSEVYPHAKLEISIISGLRVR